MFNTLNVCKCFFKEWINEEKRNMALLRNHFFKMRNSSKFHFDLNASSKKCVKKYIKIDNIPGILYLWLEINVLLIWGVLSASLRGNRTSAGNRRSALAILIVHWEAAAHWVAARVAGRGGRGARPRSLFPRCPLASMQVKERLPAGRRPAEENCKPGPGNQLSVHFHHFPSYLGCLAARI